MKQYHQNFGYDLEASLAKHPIAELQYPDTKDSLIASLKKGNVQSVAFTIDGAEKKQYVEANPHFKTINVYDGSMQRINNRHSKAEKQSEGEKSSVKQDSKKQSQSDDEEGPKVPKEIKKRRKSQSNSM
jgi:hypothetical protein